MVEQVEPVVVAVCLADLFMHPVEQVEPAAVSLLSLQERYPEQETSWQTALPDQMALTAPTVAAVAAAVAAGGYVYVMAMDLGAATFSVTVGAAGTGGADPVNPGGNGAVGNSGLRRIELIS